MKKGNDRHLWTGGKTFTPCAARTIIFQSENLNYLMDCFTHYLVFSIRLISIADLFAVCYLWNVSNEDKCCVETHRAADIIVGSLGLLTWLVYVRTYCVSIATLNQNKRSRLPYLGDAQKTSDTNLRPVNHRFPSVRVSSLTVEWTPLKVSFY